MTQLDPMLAELRIRLERLGYVVVPHGDHLCVRLPLLTSVRVRRAPDGRLTLTPQFGPLGRSGGLLATSGAATAAVGATALAAGLAPVTMVVGFLGVVALAHDACRFVLTEGALTRLQLLVTGPEALGPAVASTAPVPDASLANAAPAPMLPAGAQLPATPPSRARAGAAGES